MGQSILFRRVPRNDETPPGYSALLLHPIHVSGPIDLVDKVLSYNVGLGIEMYNLFPTAGRGAGGGGGGY